MIYLGGAWPEEYRGSLFMNNIHGARLNRDILEPEGSGFVGRHAPDFLLANDRWSQIVSLKYGPDGQVVHDRLVRQEPVPPHRASTSTTAPTGGSSRSPTATPKPVRRSTWKP